MLPLTQLQLEVERAIGEYILQSSSALGELCVTVPRLRIVETLTKLRDDAGTAMVQLMDVCGVDYPERPERFEVVYALLSLRHNARLRVKVQAGEGDAVPTATTVFSSAGWFEREVWDLFGIPFSGHPDLRRIMMDEDFEGHPLRKDFPLTGYVEIRYDADQKRIVKEPVKLAQDYRNFDYLSPWEGMTAVQIRDKEPEVKS